VQVKAPAAATVLSRKISIGSVAKAGDELFEIADLSTVWMIANVPEEHIGKLRTGMTVRVSVQAYPDHPLTGRITKLGDQMDPETRTAPVRVEIANPGERLKPEMYATAELQAGAGPASLLIAETAIQQVQGSAVVFVKKSETVFETRPVQTGSTIDNRIEIVSGLKAGETIVTQGSFVLKSRLLKKSLEEE
jgi:cobalt-zinc-cadmium efflux system membrane fusion protein